MPRRLKIAILVVDDRFDKVGIPPTFGSAPTGLLQGLARKGDEHEFHIVSCTPPMHSGTSTVMGNITFHAIPLPKFAFIHSLHLGCRLSVGRLLSKINPDVVHAMGTERWCAVSGLALRRPTMLTMHGILGAILPSSGFGSSAYWRLQEIIERKTLPFFDVVACNSKHTLDYVRKFNPRTVLIPHAIRDIYLDTPQSEVATKAVPTIVCVGTFYPLKRQLEILQIAHQINQNGVRLVFRFYGELGTEDSYSKLCRAEIVKGEALGYIHYGGRVSQTELLGEYDKAQALIHFSEEESFGLAVAEGLARGLMVFTNAAGGLRDIVSGVDGVEIVHDVSHLVDTIRRWIDDGSPKLETASLIMKQRYSPDRIADIHLDQYDRLATGTRLSRRQQIIE